MRVNLYLVKSFIRQALGSGDSAVSTVQEAIDALFAVQQGNYTLATDSDTTVIAHSSAGKSFQFQVTPGLSRASLMVHCEAAMARLERWQVANSARTTPLGDVDLLTAVRNGELAQHVRTRPDFS